MASSPMKSPSDHGRGYTWFSILSTPRRCRRRIVVMRTSSPPGSIATGLAAITRSRVGVVVAGGPVDLGVRLAQVEGRDLPRLHVLLVQCLGVRELHERRRGRVREPEVGELDLGDPLERFGVAVGAVA